MTHGLFNFFAYMTNGNIKRIPLNRGLQENLTSTFKDRLNIYLSNNFKRIPFIDNIHYKPEEDELFVINNFELLEAISNALKNPISLDRISEIDFENINAIFCGENTDDNHNIIFTLFDSRKIIKSSRIKTILFFKEGTFTDLETKMIIIDDKIDVLYSNGDLYFKSFYNARRIFREEMNKYYREATNDEVEEFSNTIFGSQIPEEYIDSISRKLIFGIMKSKLPNTQRIVQVGTESFGLNIKIKNGKIEVPSNKKEFKKLLKLLNDNLLESPLTNVKYETNSKIKINNENNT